MDIRDAVREWGGQDRGVSPVIAVILMVAITVILAAVISTFVLDIGSSLSDPTPQATFSAEQSDVEFGQGIDPTPVVNITHQSGEAIDKDNIYLTVGDERAYGAFEYDTSNGQNAASRIWDGVNEGGTDEVTAGTVAHVTGSLPTSIAKPDEVDNPSNPNDWEYGKSGDRSVVEIDIDTLGGRQGYESQLEPGDTIRIVYESTDGNSNILYEYTVT